MVVAAQHAEAHCQRSGQGMKERFLLDRIALQRSDVALRNVKRSCLVEANFADARQPLQNDAPMPTRDTSHAVIVKFLVESALDGTLRENVFEGAGFSGPGLSIVPPKIPLTKGEGRRNDSGRYAFRGLSYGRLWMSELLTPACVPPCPRGTLFHRTWRRNAV